MRCLILAAFFWCASWAFAIEVYYVDPSASGSSQDGTTANPYLTLNGALAGKCNKTFTDAIQIRCRTSASTPDTTRANTGGLTLMVTTATFYLEIVAETGNRASAAWDATKYHLYPAYGVQAGTALALDKSHIRVDGLQIGISTQTGIAEIVYWSGGVRMSNCLIRGIHDHTANLTRGISIITGFTSYVWNCVIYAIGGNIGSSAVKNHGTTNLYSCTFIQAAGIICVDAGTNADDIVTIKNCYAGTTSFEAYSGGGLGTMALTTSAASDTTGTAGLDSIAVNTTQFVNVTATTEDYHLPVGSALRAVGTDTSGDAAPLNFTTDIDGVTRTGTWFVGAALSTPAPATNTSNFFQFFGP